ncbi:hypothetical protein JQN72_13500 [Phycicoccus sp. CSK15P-2]|uniref:hypothetical protein n=1 Tax=Phycicoccus sp. CSK15P-2 TaxID=2807627 RepID=UPI0019500194|nr:hypothetical protein [Phycicoccus sp. CSK15P-2]MBM6405256.1 hypothetical protein [Phycicoccus sp. CSK15P-2]
MDLDPALAALAATRDRVVTRAELHTHGVTDARIHWLSGKGRWQVLLPGVVLLQPDAPTRRQQLVAAYLLGGPDAVIGGPAAARFHGVTGIPGHGVVHVLTPRSRARRRHSWADVRPTRLADPDVVAGSMVTFSSVARSVVDAATWAPSEEDALAWTIEAVQRGIVEVPDLFTWVNRLNRRWSARPRRAVEAAATGAWSLPESELLTLLEGSPQLPEAWMNPRLQDAEGAALPTPDVWFDTVALAVMVHSKAFHDGQVAWDRTVSQDADLSASGVVVIGVTPAAIRSQPQAVLRRVERAYASAVARPRPSVIATRRHTLALPA